MTLGTTEFSSEDGTIESYTLRNAIPMPTITSSTAEPWNLYPEEKGTRTETIVNEEGSGRADELLTPETTLRSEEVKVSRTEIIVKEEGSGSAEDPDGLVTPETSQRSEEQFADGSGSLITDSPHNKVASRTTHKLPVGKFLKDGSGYSQENKPDSEMQYSRSFLITPTTTTGEGAADEMVQPQGDEPRQDSVKLEEQRMVFPLGNSNSDDLIPLATLALEEPQQPEDHTPLQTDHTSVDLSIFTRDDQPASGDDELVTNHPSSKVLLQTEISDQPFELNPSTLRLPENTDGLEKSGDHFITRYESQTILHSSISSLPSLTDYRKMDLETTAAPKTSTNIISKSLLPKAAMKTHIQLKSPPSESDVSMATSTSANTIGGSPLPIATIKTPVQLGNSPSQTDVSIETSSDVGSGESQSLVSQVQTKSVLVTDLIPGTSVIKEQEVSGLHSTETQRSVDLNQILQEFRSGLLVDSFKRQRRFPRNVDATTANPVHKKVLATPFSVSPASFSTPSSKPRYSHYSRPKPLPHNAQPTRILRNEEKDAGFLTTSKQRQSFIEVLEEHDSQQEVELLQGKWRPLNFLTSDGKKDGLGEKGIQGTKLVEILEEH